MQAVHESRGIETIDLTQVNGSVGDAVRSMTDGRGTDSVIDAVQSAADGLGLKSTRMVSRAYHDALFMAQIAPTGMIFIPCKDGVSHRPDEYSSPKEIEKGIRTLAAAMINLAGRVQNPSSGGSDSSSKDKQEL